MPFNRPDLKTLLARAEADIRVGLPGAAPEIRRTMLGVLVRMHSGSQHGLYGYLDWLSRQILVDQADADMLDRHGSIWSVPRKAATAAQGSVAFTGLSGSTIASGTLIQRADGVQYSTNAIVVIAAGTATIDVTAVAAGSAGNSSTSTPVALVSPVTGVDSQAAVAAAGISNGSEIESDAAYRARILARVREAPHGGNVNDYINWALEVSGITRAWVYPQELGPGTVTVRCVVDDDPAGPIPDTAKVAEVQSHIDILRPVTAALTVAAPVAAPLNPVIKLTPNDAATQSTVTAELTDLLRREAQPGGTILLSHLAEAISIAAGESDHVLVSPASDVIHSAGQMATLGTITWQ